MSKYKATHEYLNTIGYLKDKPKDLMEFGEEVGYFSRVNNQRIQNMACQLSKADLMESYNEYLENPPIDTAKTKFVMQLDKYSEDCEEDIVFLKYTKSEYDRSRFGIAYLYSIQKKLVYPRVIRKGKKVKGEDQKIYFRHGGVSHNIYDFITK